MTALLTIFGILIYIMIGILMANIWSAADPLPENASKGFQKSHENCMRAIGIMWPIILPTMLLEGISRFIKNIGLPRILSP